MGTASGACALDTNVLSGKQSFQTCWAICKQFVLEWDVAAQQSTPPGNTPQTRNICEARCAADKTTYKATYEAVRDDESKRHQTKLFTDWNQTPSQI